MMACKPLSSRFFPESMTAPFSGDDRQLSRFIEAMNFARWHGLIARLGASKPYCLMIHAAHLLRIQKRAPTFSRLPTSRGFEVEVSVLKSETILRACMARQ